MAGVITTDGRCLAARRGPRQSSAGLWELPGGKVEVGERPEQALARELAEELGFAAQVGVWVGRSEVRGADREIVLDAFRVAPPERPLAPVEHDRVAWLAGAELGSVSWTPADVALLPVLRALLAEAPPEVSAAPPVAFLGCDWSVASRRRAVWLARTSSTDRRLHRLAPPVQGFGLVDLLATARELRDRLAGPVVVAIDAALGVPALAADGLAARSFFEVIERLGARGALGASGDRGAAPADERPFFRVPPGRDGLGGRIREAGGGSALLRQIDLRTAAKSVFALSGIPGTVGSGSRALWHALLPLLDAERDFTVWPFEAGAARRGAGVVLAEGFPRAAQAVALAETLPAAPRRIAKASAGRRSAALERLAGAAWVRSLGLRLLDVDAARESADDFDALFLAAALVRLACEERPLAHWLVDPLVEGGILATGAVDYDRAPSPPAMRSLGT